MVVWGHVVNLVWVEKEPKNQCRAQSWFGVWGLVDWIFCISGQAENLERHKSYLSFALLIWPPRQEWLILGPERYFNPVEALKIGILGSISLYYSRCFKN